MSAGGVKPPQLSKPIRTTSVSAPASAPVPPTVTTPATATDALLGTRPPPKVDMHAERKHRDLTTGSGSRVAGDWLAADNGLSGLFRQAMAKYFPGAAPELVPPPAGAPIAKAGEQSLIGLKDDFFDPKASYEANLEKLKLQGIPHFALLSKAERAHATAFIDAVMATPEHFVGGAEILSREEAIPTYEVDAMKRLYELYGMGKRPATEAERALRLEMNHALHPTAVAIARLAFLKQLDELSNLPEGDPRKSVFVTCGGCSAGKDTLPEIFKHLNGELPFGAVWNAAGEGDARENEWILEACAERGIKTVFGYAAADPLSRYTDALGWAEETGRVVDVATFSSSYANGARNMKSFMESPKFKDAVERGLASTFIVDVGPWDAQSNSYTQAHRVGGDNPRPSDIPPVPPLRDVFSRALDTLGRYIEERAKQGLQSDTVLKGALGQVYKFERMGALESM